MKTLKYILSVFTLSVALSTSAQVWGQQPEYNMNSTSTMVGTGTSLPMAASEGVQMTYGEEETRSSIPRRVGRGDNQGDPGAIPIGGVVWPLLLMAVGYCVRKSVRKV